MKTRAISLVAIASLLVVASAFAASSTYRGDVRQDREASVKLTVRERGNDLTVTAFRAKNFLISCRKPDDARLGRASLTGEAPVSKRGHFRLKGENDTQKLTLRGKLNGDKAKGRFSFSGLTALGNDEVRCESGRVSWTATR